MRRHGAHRFRGVGMAVVVGMVVALAASTPAVAGSLARRGATYDGSGRQPHFPLAGVPGAPSGGFIMRFRVGARGRAVQQLHVWGLAVACRGLSGGYFEPDPAVGMARIRADGTFQSRMRTVNGEFTLPGRFLRGGRARGTWRYHADRGEFRGCTATGTWTAHVKPPPPALRHYTGATDQHNRVTFARTIERHPRVTGFDFGALRTSCGGWVRVRTGPELGPPFDPFALPVRNGRFSGEYFDEAYFVDIAGTFGAHGRASGTVSYGDRGGCSTGIVRWAASPS